MLDLYSESEPIDVLTVTERLRQAGRLEAAGGAAAVDALAGGRPRRRQRPPLRADRPRARAPAAAAQRRRTRSRRASPTTTPPRASWSSTPSARCSRSPTTTARRTSARIDEVLHEELDKLHKLSIEGTALTGTPSGFKDLDEITGGFQPGNLIVIAARPSMGKSALVTNIAENAAIDDRPPGGAVLPGDVRVRARAALRRLARPHQGRRPAQGPRGRASWPKIVEASTAARRTRRCSSTTPPTSACSRSAPRRAACTSSGHGGLGLIIVDYLQLMRPDHRIESRVEQVGQMSRGLKILARELEGPGHRAVPAQPRASSRGPTSGRCSRTCASRARSSRTPTSWSSSTATSTTTRTPSARARPT